MSSLRSAADWFGPVAIVLGSVTGAAAYARAADPPAQPAAAVPWLDPAVTGAITKRVAGPAESERAEPPPPAAGRGRPDGVEGSRDWVDPPRRRFDYRLRGSI